MTARGVGTVLLVAGYPAAVIAATRLPASFRHRRPGAFLAFEAATATVVVGWGARGRWAPAAVNAVILAGLAAAWTLRGRQAHQR